MSHLTTLNLSDTVTHNTRHYSLGRDSEYSETDFADATLRTRIHKDTDSETTWLEIYMNTQGGNSGITHAFLLQVSDAKFQVLFKIYY